MSAKPAVDERQLPRYVGQRDVARMLACSVRTLQRIRNDDQDFPKPVVSGKQRKTWRVEDILAWDDARHNAAHVRLIESAVGRPDDVRDDDVVDAHRALAVRLAKAQGVEIDPDAVIGFTFQPTDDQAAVARSDLAAQQAALLAAQFDMWGDLFADLDSERAMVVANWLFPALRKQWSETARASGKPWALPTDADGAERMAWGALATANESD